MNVRQLIELLGNYDGSAEVRIAHQANWPLAEVLQSVTTLAEVADEPDCECDSEDDPSTDCPAHGQQDPDEPDTATHVWLVAGGHHWNESPYAPRSLWNAC